MSEVPEIKLSADIFLNKSTVIYGVTKTGKSKIIRNMLKLLSADVTQVCVISPNDQQNKDYSGDGLVPSPLIHYAFDINLVKEVFQRNEMMAAIYFKANDVKTIEKLFKRLNIDFLNNVIEQVMRLKDTHIQAAEDRYLYDIERKLSEVRRIEENCAEVIAKLYKTFIKKYRNLLDVKKLSDDEQYCLQYLDFNPQMVVVWDDCGAVLNSLSKEERKIVVEYFVRNRHALVTTVVAVHGDKQIHKDFRLNAFNSMFTDKATASAYFDYKENQFDSEIKKIAKRAISFIHDKKVGNQKIIFMREDREFKRFTAELISGFRFGSRCVTEYCNLIKNKEGSLDKTSKYYKYFALKKQPIKMDTRRD